MSPIPIFTNYSITPLLEFYKLNYFNNGITRHWIIIILTPNSIINLDFLCFCLQTKLIFLYLCGKLFEQIYIDMEL